MMHHYWKFRDGKVCFVRSSEDTALAAGRTRAEGADRGRELLRNAARSGSVRAATTRAILIHLRGRRE
jgi:hypothetical protein